MDDDGWEDFDDRERRKRPRTSSTTNVFAVDIDTLPPLESLKPDDLKNFSKEEIVAYLQSQGIIAKPDESKPALKQQLRQVLYDIEKRKAGIIPLPIEPQRKEIVVSPIIPDNQEAKFCEDCGTKKANKECSFRRCKGCCNKREFMCSVHLKDARAALAQANSMMQQQPQIGFVTSPSNLQKPFFSFASSPQSSLKSNSFTLPTTQLFTAASLRSPASLSQAQLVKHLLAMPPQQQQQQRPQSNPQAPKQPTIPKSLKCVECPRCGSLKAFTGSTFLAHLDQCDHEYFTSLITESTLAEHLKQHHLLLTSQIFEEALGSEASPAEAVTLHAFHRYKTNLTFLQELFSETSVSEIINSIEPLPITKDDTEQQEQLESELNFIIESSKAVQQDIQERAQLFIQNQKELKNCVSLEELESLQHTISQEFPLPLTTSHVPNKQTEDALHPRRYVSL